MIVFQKTSEEAACTYPTCTYNFTDQVPVVTNVSSEFDMQTYSWLVKINGVNFTTTTASLWIDGKEQHMVALVPA